MTTSNHTEQQSTPSVRALPMLFLKSFAVMIPWPLLGIILCYRMFDQPDEAVLLFGGITGIAAFIVMAVVDLPDTAFAVIIVVAWCLALVAPPVAMYRWRSSQTAIVALLLIQGGFSIAQAALGALMILGKSA
jgi:hypothetical protein